MVTGPINPGGCSCRGGIAFIARWIYLLLIFPALMGFTSGSATTVAIKKGKARSPLVGVLFGVLAGLSTYGAYHGGEYFLLASPLPKRLKLSWVKTWSRQRLML